MKTSQCHTLPLPSSGLPYLARHAAVTASTDGSTAAVLAVSPEGQLRVWSRVDTPSAYTDAPAIDDGHVVHEVIAIDGRGHQFIVATTHCNLHLVTVHEGVQGRLSPLQIPH